MDNNELTAIEKFAENLRLDFPILAEPRGFTDEMTNLCSEYAQRRIDEALKKAREAWEAEVRQEVEAHG